MKIPTHFISGDWGTTNFRLRLVETSTLQVLAQINNDQGIRAVHQKYSLQHKINQHEYFLDFLSEQILQFPKEHQKHLVILTGMASANIGLLELGYADFPISKNGNNLKWKYLSKNNKIKTLLISGVKSSTGMMRGEEIQAVGLEEYLAPFGKGILLLPGTHSKHLTYKERKFTGLKSFMTGELFELLSKKSILSYSVDKGPLEMNREDFFKEGLILGFEHKLTESLFSIRARDILHTFDKKDNLYFLSGLLIGDELSYLKKGDGKIFLAAFGQMYRLYRIALQTLFDNQKLVFFNGNVFERAFLLGQRKILYQYGK